MASADEMYGPITTLRRDKQPVKHIPWAAFKLVEADWKRVIDARDILGVSPVNFHSSRMVNIQIPQDSNRIQQYFSSEKEPTLWHALPALEEL